MVNRWINKQLIDGGYTGELLEVEDSAQLAKEKKTTASVNSSQHSSGQVEEHWDFFEPDQFFSHFNEAAPQAELCEWTPPNGSVALTGVWRMATQAMPLPGVIRYVHRVGLTVGLDTELDSSRNLIREGQLQDTHSLATSRLSVAALKRNVVPKPPVDEIPAPKKARTKQQKEADADILKQKYKENKHMVVSP